MNKRRKGEFKQKSNVSRKYENKGLFHAIRDDLRKEELKINKNKH